MRPDPFTALVVTSSFPRFHGDRAGNFIGRLIRSMAEKSGWRFHVLAPADGSFPNTGEEHRTRITRFRYFWPMRFQRFAYGNGILYNLRKDVFAWFQAPFFFAALFFSCFRQAQRADLIHAHWLVPSGLIAGWIAGWRKKSLIITAHGSDIQLIRKIPFGKQLLKHMVKRAKAVTVISEKGRQTLRDILKNEPELHDKIQVLPMGVHQESFEASQNGSKQSEKTVLYLGRLVHTKGVDLLLKALAPFKDVQLLIAGDGCEKEKLMKEAASLGVHSRFLSWVGEREKKALFHRADCLVIPSRDEKEGESEGLPLALLESMASGCPVVASRVGGISEVVRHQENGFLVEPNQAESLSDGIRTVLEDDELRNRMRDEGMKTARAFDMGGVTEKWIKMYLKVLGN